MKVWKPFIVKHYGDDERPIIKGNGFDGTEIGDDREEAQAFIDWVNARLDRVRELEAALQAIHDDYGCAADLPITGVKNIHTGNCVGCPACDALDVLARSQSDTGEKHGG